MTDENLAAGIAAVLRGYATAPLSACNVYEDDQLGYESLGNVTVVITGGSEVPEAIGEQFADEISLVIVGRVLWGDTVATKLSIRNLCKQIRYCLRGTNRRLQVVSEYATRNSNISCEYGYESNVDRTFRTCQVRVTYRVPQDAVT